MAHYNATIEIAELLGDEPSADLLDALADFGPALTESLRRRTQVIITVQADSLRGASTAALSIVEGTGHAPVTVQLMPTAEYDATAGMIDAPARLYSVTEAAELLGVTPQAIRARIKTGSLPATRIGESWAVPAVLVEGAETGR